MGSLSYFTGEAACQPTSAAGQLIGLLSSPALTTCRSPWLLPLVGVVLLVVSVLL